MRVPVFEIPQGDQRYADIDFNPAADRLGTSASSATWTVEEGSTVTISGTPSIASNVAQGLLAADANRTGCSLIKIKATMADTQTVTEYIKINVIDPTC